MTMEKRREGVQISGVKKKPESTAGTTALIPQPHGGALKPGGTLGNAGGRPPDEFKAKMREMASRPEALAYLEQCVKGDHGPQAAIKAHQHITERGYGRMAQPIEGVEGKPLTVQIVVPGRKA